MDTDRPRLVYDDDCGFCTWCADWAVRHGEFEPVGFSALTEEDRDRLPDEYEECVHLLTDEEVYSCGEATEEVIARTEKVSPEIFGFLSEFSDYEHFRKEAYRFVADRREQLGMVVSVDPPVTRRD